MVKVEHMWDRKQKRTYKNLKSWMIYEKSQGGQLLRVDLTSIIEREKSLTENFKELRRRVERVYGYKVGYFKIETNEGNGVLHMVWSIRQKKAVWIPQKWLSEEWEKISGAKIVYIKRITETKGSMSRIGGYLVEQYLAGQGAIVRVSWSWWRSGLAIGKAFKDYYMECKQNNYGRMIMGMSKLEDYKYYIDYKKMMEGWNCLLERGSCQFNNLLFMITDKGIDFAYL